MEPARPRSHRRRPRRGSADRPVNTSLVRAWSLVLVGPLLLLLFTVMRPGTYPAGVLPPAFDDSSALQLTRELSRDHPRRVPGTPEALGVERWYRDKLALYGLTATADTWRQDVPGLGETELRNLVTVVPGELPQTIILVAHRDNDGLSPGANDNASGTAALIELARAYSRTGTIPRRQTPQHTLVFLSSDAGSFGALGAARFAGTSPLARRAVAVLALDGLGGRARPRLELNAYEPRSPAPAFVHTLAVRVAEQTGERPAQPDWLTQIVALALPFGYGEQAPFLTAGRSAVRLATAPDGDPPSNDDFAQLDARRLGQLGRAVETTLASLDGRIRAPDSAPGVLYLGDRAVRGWALQLLLVTAIAPFGIAVLDILIRCVRRGIALAGAWRALRLRIGVTLGLAAVVFAGALAGVFPRTTTGPAPPDAPPVDDWPVLGLAVLGLASAVWIALARRRLGHSRQPNADEELAGYAVTFAALLALAVVVVVVNAYALVFVLPSLYAWVWLPQLRGRPGWRPDVLFGLGLVGPVAALVVLETQLDLGLRAPLYAIGLATSGIVPWAASIAFLVWLAAAAQIGSLVSGRFAPTIGQVSAR